MTQPTQNQEFTNVLNVPFIARLCLLVMVGGPLAYFWHGYQINRLAAHLINRASEQEENEKWTKAVDNLQQYLQIRPADTQARVRLAKTFGKSATTANELRRSVRYFDEAIGLADSESRAQLQCLQADALFRLGEYEDTWRITNSILKDNPKNQSALRLKVMSNCLRYRTNDSSPSQIDIKEVDKAGALNPGDNQLIAITARFLREFADADGKADSLIEQLLETNDRDAKALLTAYRYSKQYALGNTDSLLDEALARKDLLPEVALEAGERSLERLRDAKKTDKPQEEQQNLYKLAREHFKRAIELNPLNRNVYTLFARTHQINEEPDLAIEVLKQGLRTVGKKDVKLLAALVEIQIEENNLELAGKTLVNLDRAVREITPRLRRTKATTISLFRDQIRAEWLLASGKTGEAEAILERITLAKPGAGADDLGLQLQKSSLGRLAEVLAAQSRWDEAAVAYDKLIDEDPSALPIRFAAAQAWSKANQPAAAVRRYEDLLRFDITTSFPARGDALVAYAMELNRLERKSSSTTKNYNRVLDAVKQARLGTPDSWELTLLEADLVLTAGVFPEYGTAQLRKTHALEILQKMERQVQDSPRGLEVLSLSYQRLGASDKAKRIFELSKAQLRDSPDRVALLHAQLLQSRGDIEAARQTLDEVLRSNPQILSASIVLAMAQLELQDGNRDAAKHVLAEHGRKQPKQPEIALALFKILLVEAESSAEMRKELAVWDDHLQQTSAPESVKKYCRARRLLLEATSTSDPKWMEVGKLQADIVALRPTWSLPYVLQARQYRRQEQHYAAIAPLKEAIALGNHDAETVGLLVDSLYREQRYTEAAKYLSLVEQSIPLSEGLSSIAISVATELGDRGKAIALAKLRVSVRPTDPLPKIWLGQALQLSGQTEEAEATYREATQIAPSDPRPWNALFTFYALSKEKDLALNTLKEMSIKTNLVASQQEYILGQGHELLGEIDLAKQHYLEASKLDSENVGIKFRYAKILARTDPEEALPRLRAIASKSSEAKNYLAALLANIGGEKNWREAMTLLRSDERSDVRIRALLLAGRKHQADRTLARELFEQIIQESDEVRSDDRYFLARLYEYEKKYSLAREQYRIVASQTNAEQVQMIAFAKFLLRHKQWEDAQRWIDEIAKLFPGSMQTLNLRVHLLEGLKNSRGAENAIDKYLSTSKVSGKIPEEKRKILVRIGQLCTSTGNFMLAEKYFRKLMEDVPRAYIAVALASARQGETVEAVELCKANCPTPLSPESVQNLALVLMADPNSSEANAIAEPLLREAEAIFSDNITILNSLGAVQHLQNKLDEAMRLYGMALDIDKNNLTTLNNVATLLAEQPDRREKAKEIVEYGLELNPNSAGLIDNQGMILYYEGKYEAARQSFQRAVNRESEDLRYHFHLALALYKTGDIQTAQDELDHAINGKIHLQILTPSELQLLGTLKSNLK